MHLSQAYPAVHAQCLVLTYCPTSFPANWSISSHQQTVGKHLLCTGFVFGLGTWRELESKRWTHTGDILRKRRTLPTRGKGFCRGSPWFSKPPGQAMLPEEQQVLKRVSKEQVERRERKEPGGRMSRCRGAFAEFRRNTQEW